MKSITLKDIPPAVHAALKRRAHEHGRSLNREALACLAAAVAPARTDVPALLRELRSHRAEVPGRLTDRLIRRASDEGRP